MALQNISSRIGNYMSMVKFAHTIFALPFALFGFFLATHENPEALSLKKFLLVLICMFLARNAAMSFNRWADREIDKLNPRTSKREIPSDIIKAGNALAFCIINALLFILATWFINKLCFYLSPIALMIVLGYSLTKRFTSVSHFILGLGLALAPTGAYLAVSEHFSLIPIIISLAVLFWVTGFDIIYALQDEAFDRDYNLHSLPVMLGTRNALLMSLILHLVSVGLLVFTGTLYHTHYLYWIGFLIFLVLLLYQHAILKPHDLSRLNLAFFTLNGIASLIFSAFAIADLLLLVN